MINPGEGAVIPALPTPRQNIQHRAWIVVVFFVVLAASCAVLAGLLPFPQVPLVHEKIEYLAHHGDEYDVLFVGSSRVHCQVMPSIFDRIARENGVPVKSFNVGINGMQTPENIYMLEEILRRPHRRLRWVFLETSRFTTGLVDEDTARFRYWHDTARFVLVARRLWEKAGENEAKVAEARPVAWQDRWEIWSETMRMIFGHARHWVLRAINLGRGAEALDVWLRAPWARYVPDKDLGPEHDGWLAMDRGRGAMAGEARALYDRDYAARLVQPAGKDRALPVTQSAFERMRAIVSQAGATLVLVIAPTPADRNLFPTEAWEKDMAILDFSDVRQYPELFVREHRVDFDHLNTDGAKLFSEDLARRFVEIAKGRGQVP